MYEPVTCFITSRWTLLLNLSLLLRACPFLLRELKEALAEHVFMLCACDSRKSWESE